MKDGTLSGWADLGEEAVAFLPEVDRFLGRELPAGRTLRSWDRELVTRAAGLGLQGILLDDDLGLQPGRTLLAAAASELVAARAPALAMAVGCARIHSVMLARFAGQALRERWLDTVAGARAIGSMAISEPEAGTDIRGIRTVARRTDAGWVLDGEKAWVTLGPVADFSFVLAKIDSPDRKADMGVFVVEREFAGVRYGPEENIRAFGAVPVGGLALTSVAVPDTHVVATSGGFTRALAGVNYARLEAACLGVGILRGSTEIALRHARDRTAGGVPIEQHQAVQLSVGRSVTQLEAARALLYRTAAVGLDRLEPARIGVLKAFATEAALEAASRAISVQGAMGLLDERPAMQLFQDAKAAQIFDGTTDILLMHAARAAARALG